MIVEKCTNEPLRVEVLDAFNSKSNVRVVTEAFLHREFLKSRHFFCWLLTLEEWLWIRKLGPGVGSRVSEK